MSGMLTPAHHQLQTALHLHQRGDHSAAEKAYQRALSIDNRLAQAHSNLGAIKLAKGDLNTAIRCWENALAIDDGLVDALTNLGAVFTQLQQYDRAINCLQRVVELQPGMPDSIKNLAAAYHHAGQLEKVLSVLRPLTTGTVFDEAATIMTAEIQAAMGKESEAIRLLQRSKNHKAASAEVSLMLARLQQQHGQHKQAKETYQHACVRHPNNLRLLFESAHMLFQMGEYEQSLYQLEKAIRYHPNHGEAHALKGDVLYHMGRSQDAVVAYKGAFRLKPGDDAVRAKLSQLLMSLTPNWHLSMLADHERNDAFERAIANAVTPSTTVLDIGAGSGLLSLMAHKYGAKKVYACEASPHLADVAQEVIDLNGANQGIELFKAHSSQLTADQFADKPTVLVAEIFDTGLIGEMAIPSIRHALTNLCADNCRVIPSRAQIYGRLIQCDDLKRVSPVNSVSGFDLTPFDIFRVTKTHVQENLHQISHEYLSTPILLKSYNFERLGKPVGDNERVTDWLEVKIEREGQLHAVVFWFALWLDSEIKLTTAPERRNNHWHQAIYVFESDMKVEVGDTVRLELHSNDTRIWFGEPMRSGTAT